MLLILEPDTDVDLKLVANNFKFEKSNKFLNIFINSQCNIGFIKLDLKFSS